MFRRMWREFWLAFWRGYELARAREALKRAYKRYGIPMAGKES